jgi:hypothetical protein
VSLGDLFQSGYSVTISGNSSTGRDDVQSDKYIVVRMDVQKIHDKFLQSQK